MDKIYFCVSDIHSFYDELMKALKEKGWEDDNPAHILIVCGDLFDRGPGVIELLDFIQRLRREGRVILIRGNHEDLFLDCVNDIEGGLIHLRTHHISNRTYTTYLTLARAGRVQEFIDLIQTMHDYYELGDYVFIHGGMPIGQFSHYSWSDARWLNGMRLAHEVPVYARGQWSGKTIVCGHWHTGWGHYNVFKRGDDELSCLDIYHNPDDAIIALDARTVYSGKINVLRLRP